MLRSATLLVALAAVAGAQSPRRLELTERLRLDAATEDFSALTMKREGNAPFYVGPRHEIVLPLPQDGTVRIYDSTGKRVKTLGGKGAGPGEYRSIFRTGWTRDTLWVYDPLLRRITFYAGEYALVRSDILSEALHQRIDAEHPTGISDFAPSAIAMGGNALGQVIEVTGRDPATNQIQMKYHVAAVSPNASLKKLVEIPTAAVAPRVWVPNEGTGMAYAPVAFANDAVYSFSTAGDRFAIVTTDRAAKTFTVTMRNATGEITYSRAYPFTPIPIPGNVADSAAAASAKWNRRYTEPVIKRLTDEGRKLIPPSYPPVKSVVLARDGSTWLRTTDAAGNDQATVLDAKGNVSATIPLKRTLDIVEADGNRVWAVDVDDDGLASVVVFTLKPAGGR